MAGLTDPLSLAVFHEGPVTVVRISGSAGMIEADLIREKLESVAAQPAQRVVLDLDELEFISSAGLSAIVSARNQVQAGGGRIVLANPIPAVRKIVEATRLSTLSEVFDSLQQAVISLADKNH